MEKPRLLHETAEIALTEIKRFLEPKLIDQFNLRRVSAPLYLPVDSPLLDRRFPGPHAMLPGLRSEVEIVGSLDVWLRGQLTRYDIAPGFGVFTIMNAIQPNLPENRVSSPYIAAWAWQQAAEEGRAGEKQVISTAAKIHALLIETEKKILTLFPHLIPTLGKDFRVVYARQMQSDMPDMSEERRLYQLMHHAPCESSSTSSVSTPVLYVIHNPDEINSFGELWVWNRLLCKPIRMADIGAWYGDDLACPSVGGNIYRRFLAMQILQQTELL